MFKTADEFFDAYHERIEEACKNDTYGDPTTDRDNKAPISERAMRIVGRECFDIFSETGAFIDRAVLLELLRYLTGADVDQDPVGFDVYGTASFLLQQLDESRS